MKVTAYLYSSFGHMVDKKVLETKHHDFQRLEVFLNELKSLKEMWNRKDLGENEFLYFDFEFEDTPKEMVVFTWDFEDMYL